MTRRTRWIHGLLFGVVGCSSTATGVYRDAAARDADDGRAVLDATDVADVTDANEVGDVRDANDVTDARDGSPAACDDYVRGRSVTVTGFGLSVVSVNADVPLPTCAVNRSPQVRAVRVTRLSVPFTGLVRITHREADSVAIRRVCDDAATELRCAAAWGPSFRDVSFTQRLTAGTYDVVSLMRDGGDDGNHTLAAAPESYADEAPLRCVGSPGFTDEVRAFDLRAATERAPACEGAPEAPAVWIHRGVNPGERVIVAAQYALDLGRPDAPAADAATAMRTSVRLLPGCGARACLATASSPPGYPAVASWINTGRSPVDVALATTAFDGDAPAPVLVRATVQAETEPARCADAPTLARAGELLVEASAGDRDGPRCGVAGSVAQPVGWRAVRVPPRSVWVATATATLPHARYAPWVRVLPMCGATTCLGAHASSSLAWGGADTITVENRGDAETVLRVAVGLFTDRADAPPLPARLRWETLPLATGGATCGDAPLASDGMFFTPQGAVATLPACAGGGSQAVQYLALDLAANTVTTLPGAFVSVDGCAATCASPTAATTLTNAAETTRRVILAYAPSGMGGTRFDVRRVPLATSVCDGARRYDGDGYALVPGAPDGGAVTNLCAAGAVSPETLVRRVLAPGEVLQVISSGPTPTVFEGCAATACPRDVTPFVGSPPGVAVANRTSAPRELLLTTPTPALLWLASRRLAPNDSCATAQRLTPGVPVTGVDATTAGPSPTGEMPRLYYRVNVPAGRQLVATMRPVADARPRWWALAMASLGCDTPAVARSSSAEAQRNGARFTAPMVWRNTGSADVDVTLAVLATANEDARFDLTATIEP